MDYLRRSIDTELDEILPLAPAVAIDGPKGVGKTQTALRRARTTWFLDRPEHAAVVGANPELLTSSSGTVLLDEWQRVPSVWDAVRRQVDAGVAPGRFLLTGSATPVQGVDTHSGAGRILSLRMRPMGLHERGVADPTVSLADLLAGSAEPAGSSALGLGDYVREIVGSGFPAIRTQPDRLRRGLLDGYLQRVIDRELPDQGLAVRRPETLRRWLAAYAAATSTTAAYSRILDAATAGDGTQPAKTTTMTYRDMLGQLWLIDPIPGWSPSRSPFTRLQQAPKHQLADPALAARILGLSDHGLLTPRGSAHLGPLFEALAALTIRVAAQASEARVGHLRTRNGDHEVDLIVEGPDGQVLGVEVKLSPEVTSADVRHLLWLREHLPEDVCDLMVVTTGSVAYRRRDGVAVVPLGLLGD